MNAAIPLQHPANLAELPSAPARTHSKLGTMSLLTALGGLLLLIALWVIGALVEDKFDDSVRYEVVLGKDDAPRRIRLSSCYLWRSWRADGFLCRRGNRRPRCVRKPWQATSC